MTAVPGGDSALLIALKTHLFGGLCVGGGWVEAITALEIILHSFFFLLNMTGLQAAVATLANIHPRRAKRFRRDSAQIVIVQFIMF